MTLLHQKTTRKAKKPVDFIRTSDHSALAGGDCADAEMEASMGHTVNTLTHILRERAAFPNRATWRAHLAQQRRAAKAPQIATMMQICGGDLRVGDAIAISTTRGMESYEAPVASTDAGDSFLTTFTRTDGTRGSVAADERIWVRRVEG